MFKIADEIARATSAYLASTGVAIPKSIMKQTEGKCIHCGYMTEDTDEGEWLHEDCREILVAEQREDQRLDDPRHVPYANLGRGR